jgi:ABC-2 type transport system permease protein
VIEGIASFFPETAMASFCTMLVLALILAVIIHTLIKNIVVTCAFAVIAEAVLAILYFVNSSLFEGLIQDILGVFDLTGHFSDFASGILDVTGIIYYLSVIGIFLFLTVQSIQKRRWS